MKEILEILNEPLQRLAKLKQKLDNARPLPIMALNKLQENNRLEWTYHSNAIEGNTLNLNETRVVLEDGITIGGKTIREHLEVINHQNAIYFLEDLVQNNADIREIEILKLHETILKGIDDDFAGRLRTGMVRISGAKFTPPAANKVSDLFDQCIQFLNQNPHNWPAPILAAYFHHQLVYIHPFFDGNGRTARLAMNLYLMKNGYPPLIIQKADRKKYYSALRDADAGRHQKLCLLVIQELERSLIRYLEVLPNEYEAYEPISNIVSEEPLPYGMEYISLLARSGKIPAIKEGKTWHTTRRAVLNYALSKKNKNKND